MNIFVITHCTEFEVNIKLELGSFPVLSSIALVGSSFQLVGCSGKVTYSLVTLVVAVLLNE